jgi:hypothetical protein
MPHTDDTIVREIACIAYSVYKVLRASHNGNLTIETRNDKLVHDCKIIGTNDAGTRVQHKKKEARLCTAQQNSKYIIKEQHNDNIIDQDNKAGNCTRGRW